MEYNRLIVNVPIDSSYAVMFESWMDNRLGFTQDVAILVQVAKAVASHAVKSRTILGYFNVFPRNSYFSDIYKIIGNSNLN